MNLHGTIDHAAEHLARIELRDRRLGAKVFATVGLPRAFPRQPPRRAQLDLRIREHPLYSLPLREQLAESAALLGMIDRHPERRDTHADVARRVREAQPRQQIETQVQPFALGPKPLLDRHDAVLEVNFVGERRRAQRAKRPRRESRRALLDYEAGDSLAPGLRVGAGEYYSPLRLMRMRNENLRAVEDVGIALANCLALDRAGWIGAARRLGDCEERMPRILDRAAGVSALLLLGARVDHRRRRAPEHPASGVVESHAMLRHLFHQHAHVESAEAAAAVLTRRTHAPQPSGLILARDTPVVVLGNFGGVGIASRFDRNNFLADYFPHLVAQRPDFRRQYESVVSVHQNSSSAGFPVPSSPR